MTSPRSPTANPRRIFDIEIIVLCHPTIKKWSWKTQLSANFVVCTWMGKMMGEARRIRNHVKRSSRVVSITRGITHADNFRFSKQVKRFHVVLSRKRCFMRPGVIVICSSQSKSSCSLQIQYLPSVCAG